MWRSRCGYGATNHFQKWNSLCDRFHGNMNNENEIICIKLCIYSVCGAHLADDIFHVHRNPQRWRRQRVWAWVRSLLYFFVCCLHSFTSKIERWNNLFTPFANPKKKVIRQKIRSIDNFPKISHNCAAHGTVPLLFYFKFRDSIPFDSISIDGDAILCFVPRNNVQTECTLGTCALCALNKPKKKHTGIVCWRQKVTAFH